MGNLMEVKKGEKVALFGFTGISFGLKLVERCDKKTIMFTGRMGEMIFDRKTGIQTNNAKGDRWANVIYPADELEQHLRGKQAPVKSLAKTKKDEAVKAPKAKAAPAKAEEEDEEDEEPAAPAKKASKKAPAAPVAPAKAAKKPVKKAAPVKDEDEDEDDGDYEEA